MGCLHFSVAHTHTRMRVRPHAHTDSWFWMVRLEMFKRHLNYALGIIFFLNTDKPHDNCEQVVFYSADFFFSEQKGDMGLIFKTLFFPQFPQSVTTRSG